MEGIIYYTILSEEEQKKKTEHMVGEKLLEIGLLREYGKDLKFEPRAKGEYGKPFFTLEPGIHYNISHSGKYVMCIFAPEPVGIDVQEYQALKFEAMLKRMVPLPMIPQILRSDNMVERFFNEWALREAYIKWTGEGLSRDLRTIPMDEGTHVLLDLDEGYAGAVWSRSPLTLKMEYTEADISAQ